MAAGPAFVGIGYRPLPEDQFGTIADVGHAHFRFHVAERECHGAPGHDVVDLSFKLVAVIMGMVVVLIWFPSTVA